MVCRHRWLMLGKNVKLELTDANEGSVVAINKQRENAVDDERSR
jgi:hypothetical protein